MSDKRPSKHVLQLLFTAIDENKNGSLCSEEIGKMCEKMGGKFTGILNPILNPALD
jgi:hypothetical protein